MVCALLTFVAIWAWKEYINTPPYIDHEIYPVRGIDISSHNGMINFEGVASDSIEFVFIKASEGTGFRDPNFSINYEKAHRAGLRVGAYHYFRFDEEGRPQAVQFLKTIGNRSLDLGVAIDVEEHGNAKGVDDATIKSRLTDMIEYLNMRGYRTTLYSNTDGYYQYLSPQFEGMPVWICSFYEDPFEQDFSFWQYSHSGKVKGIEGKVDLNVFSGSREDWRQYLLDSFTSPEEGKTKEENEPADRTKEAINQPGLR